MEISELNGSKYRVIWSPQKGPQSWLLSCPVFEIFFGGARGGGKSDGMLGDFASHADEFGEDAIGLVIRRELTQLKELIERSKQIYGPLGAVWHVGEKMWRFPNGARLTFAYIDNDDDADKYQGHSYSRIYVEEMGNFASPVPIFKLMACIRSANPKVRCGFRATGNPGGPGHLWIKQRYIMPAPRGMQVLKSKFVNPFTKEEYELERVFIPSKITDNKYNNNPQYVARLQMVGNARLVDAWLLGNWDIIEGAYFDEWDERKHVTEQFIIPAHWTRFTSMDWGSAKPFSIGWWAIVPDRYDPMVEKLPSTFDPKYAYRNNLPRGAMIRYREWYGCQVDENGLSQHNNIGLKLTIGQLAAGISEREKREPVNDQGRPRMAYRVAGLDLFKEEGGPSLAERMASEPYYQFWIKADNARVARKGAIGGWDMVRNRLIGENGEPMIYFFPNCVDSIRTLPALQHDKDNLEDVDTDSEDHCFAAGTMVDTVNGPIAIENLPSYGFVHSVDDVQAYRNARLVKKDANVVRLTFEDGSTIICTPDHGFLVGPDEFRYAAFLKGESVLCSQSLSAEQYKSPSSAGKTARRVHCVNVEKLNEKMDVYCLTVPSNGLFSIEGGILVSNCPDEIRYACMSRPYSRPEGGGEKGRVMKVGPDNELQIKDVMGDFEKQREAKFIPYKRI